MSAPSPLSPRTRRLILAIDRLALFLARHWLLLVILLLAIISGLPILAPVLASYGFDGPAQSIYFIYGFSCHQLAYRSFFFFGAQPAYSIDQLQAALGATNPGSDLFFWRQIHGNSELGYKMAWCERDAAIFGSMLLAFILFGIIRPRVRPLDARTYVLFLIPMAVDGLWQLATSPLALVPFLPTHESSPELRVITGALFGIANVWLVFPYVEQSMRETFEQAKRQSERILA